MPVDTGGRIGRESNQLAQGLAFLDDVARATAVILIGGIKRHTEVVVDSGCKVAWGHGAVVRVDIARADAGDETCSATRRIERDVCL